jgi:hypothetical protein
VKKDFGFSLLVDLNMQRKPNWMKKEYALAQENLHYKEFEKYSCTQIEKVMLRMRN